MDIVSNLYPEHGEPSAWHCGPRSVFPLVFIHSLMVRRKEPISPWKPFLDACVQTIPILGARNSLGLSMHTSPCQIPRQAYPHSRAPWGTNLHYSQTKRPRSQTRRYKPTSKGVRGSGRRPDPPCARRPRKWNNRPIAIEPLLQITSRDRRYGLKSPLSLYSGDMVMVAAGAGNLQLGRSQF